MPQTTKYIIAEQVLFRLNGGVPDTSSPVQYADVYKAIEQKINSLFKLQQFSVNLPQGGTIPDNLALASYEGVPLLPSTAGKCKCKLPVMPISLPRNAGINEIRPVIAASGDRIVGQPFIPLQAGQSFLLQADSLLNDLMGQVSYEPNGAYVVFSKDLLSLQITAVDMKLVVFDISQYSETDPLPIPSDMEKELIDDLVKTFAPVQAESGIVNPFTTAEQQNGKQ